MLVKYVSWIEVPGNKGRGKEKVEKLFYWRYAWEASDWLIDVWFFILNKFVHHKIKSPELMLTDWGRIEEKLRAMHEREMTKL